MRTTLDLPDELFRQAKAKAALDGTTLKNLLTRYVEHGLRHPAPPTRQSRRRSALPVIKASRRGTIPSLTSPLQAKLEREEDLAKLRRSFGR